TQQQVAVATGQSGPGQTLGGRGGAEAVPEPGADRLPQSGQGGFGGEGRAEKVQPESSIRCHPAFVASRGAADQPGARFLAVRRVVPSFVLFVVFCSARRYISPKPTPRKQRTCWTREVFPGPTQKMKPGAI